MASDHYTLVIFALNTAAFIFSVIGVAEIAKFTITLGTTDAATILTSLSVAFLFVAWVLGLILILKSKIKSPWIIMTVNLLLFVVVAALLFAAFGITNVARFSTYLVIAAALALVSAVLLVVQWFAFRYGSGLSMTKSRRY